MNSQILKYLISDLDDVNASLKEGMRDTERGVKNALSGDYNDDTDKVIEQLAGNAGDACFEIDKAIDMIKDIMRGLENTIDQAEFDMVAQKATKKL